MKERLQSSGTMLLHLFLAAAFIVVWIVVWIVCFTFILAPKNFSVKCLKIEFFRRVLKAPMHSLFPQSRAFHGFIEE